MGSTKPLTSLIVIISSDQSLQSLLKNDAFGGRGEAGPCVLLTDDSKAEKGAIAQVFPEATQLLCIFHLLQAVWRCLWNKEDTVEMKDRQTLFSIVKYMLYAREMSRVESASPRQPFDHQVEKIVDGRGSLNITVVLLICLHLHLVI